MNDAQSHLWELTGSHWILPIQVQPVESGLALVKIPGIPLLRSQRDVLEHVLSQMAIGVVDDGWNIPMYVLQSCAERSTETDPEMVVAWMRKPQTESCLPKHKGADEFVADWVMASGLFKSRAAGMAVFVSMMTHMMHWLVNKRRPVNLLSVTLTPLHYRSNWKEIVLGRFLVERLGQRFPDLKWLTGYRPTPAEVCHEDLLAWNENMNIAEWTVECHPSEWFRSVSNEQEKKKKGTNRVMYYLPMVVRDIMDHRDRAADIWRDWSHTLGRKVVELPHFNVGDGGVFTRVKEHSSCKVRRPARSVVFPHCLTPDAIAACVESNEDIPDRDLPKMSGVQPDPNAVRDAGTDVPGREDELP